MKTIVFVHGLGGTSYSKCGVILEKELGNEYRVIHKDIPFKPEEALTFIQDLIDKNKPDLVVANSLGGFYASLMNGNHKLLLINPALEGPIDLLNSKEIKMGICDYHDPREDGIQQFEITYEYITLLKELLTMLNQDKIKQKEVYAIFGKDEEVLPKYHFNEIFNLVENPKTFVYKNMKHSLTVEQYESIVVPLVKNILDD